VQLREYRRERGGKALAEAIRAAKSSKAAVARGWGTSEEAKTVDHVVDGEMPLTWEKSTTLPPEVERALLTKRLHELDAAEPRSHAPEEVQVNEIVRALGDASGSVLDMIADGKREPHERRRVGQDLMKVERLVRVARISTLQKAEVEEAAAEEKHVSPDKLAAILAAAEDPGQ